MPNAFKGLFPEVGVGGWPGMDRGQVTRGMYPPRMYYAPFILYVYAVLRLKAFRILLCGNDLPIP